MIEGFRKALGFPRDDLEQMALLPGEDRKSTRLNSSHSQISYAVFCLKKEANVAPPRLVGADGVSGRWARPGALSLKVDAIGAAATQHPVNGNVPHSSPASHGSSRRGL